MEWKYKGHELTELPNDITDFVYVIIYEDWTRYIGKKTVRSFNKKKLGKKELALLPDKRHKDWKWIVKEHKWRDYQGSHAVDVKRVIKTKIITHLCTTKRTATYLEAKEMFEVDATINSNYLNANILGSFYYNCMDGIYEGEVSQKNLFTLEELE